MTSSQNIGSALARTPDWMPLSVRILWIRYPNAGPIPQGNYAPALRDGGTIYVSGVTPRLNGILTQQGPILPDADPLDYRDAAQLTAENARLAATAQLVEGEEIAAILNMTVYLFCSPDFTTHSAIADLAS
jgi:enamine deaminase RidA (YjgF/YER057c/UK114 family)